MDRVKDKVAVITGAAQGIGETYAKALAGEGAKVVISDIDNPNRAVEEIQSSGGTAMGVIADVTDDTSLAALVATTESEFGNIDILVNNAALFTALRITPIMEMSNDEWDRTMKVNVRGTLQTTKAVVPSMVKNGGGKIINISSGTFYYGGPGMAHYVCSKGAIIAFTRSASREFADKNILVNCIAPGLTISEGVDNHPDLHVAREPTVQSRAIKREMVPEDINGTLLFLASDDSDFITGQTYNVDGGKFNQ
ncbi:MAG: 3-oxoacyl-ACP reductase family protein [Pseudomonadota bacterium]|mgnify:FL=1|nr:3-oxoacyl-ACP reductase family protein [Pseudomonadota bacterium]